MDKECELFRLECRPFTYGFYCSQTCNCSSDLSNGCDPRTGKCRCKSGYYGERCETGKMKRIPMKFLVFSLCEKDVHKDNGEKIV